MKCLRPTASPMEGLHYFCLTFQGSDTCRGGALQMSSAYMGWIDKRVTLPMIREAKRNLGLGMTAHLVGCAYLGWMTPDEFHGTELRAESRGRL